MSARDATVGLALAGAILGGWGALLAATLFVIDWSVLWPLAPLAIGVQIWLFVGLFIVAHDAIHGTLAPGLPRVNRIAGWLFVTLYAGFDFDALARDHAAHHRHSGTDADPDFDAAHPTAFWPWYRRFFLNYFGLRQLAILAAASALLALAMGPRAPLMLVFWALPAILSSLQLFYFGTFRPHRHGAVPFADGHRARGERFSWPVSLLTCFHFGHHHKHHAMPWLPWWRLPGASAAEGARECRTS